MYRQKIALIGANSRIGPAILDALLEKPHYEITILTRPSSKPVPHRPHVRIVIVPSTTVDAYAAALDGQSALIGAVNPNDLDIQMLLADACVQAGVERYIPADYGSMRSDDPYVLDLLPGFRNKQRVRQHCQRLAEDHPSFSWTSFASGHFFDYGLTTALLGFDLRGGTVDLFDGGEGQFSASTVKQIGRAVAAILEKEEETRNRMLLVQSFCVTQRQVKDVIEKHGKKLEGDTVESKKLIRHLEEELERGGGLEVMEELVAVLGIKRSNWTGEERLANELLGLTEEDLDEVVKEVLDSF